MTRHSDEVEHRASEITIPEYEEKIKLAHSQGAEKVDLEALHNEYHDARLKAAREEDNEDRED